MIIIGLVLLLIGLPLQIVFLSTVGLLVLAGGMALMLLGRTGSQIGSRRHYW